MDHLEPWHLLVASLAVILTGVTILFVGGKWVGRIETLAEGLKDGMREWKDDRKTLQQIPVLANDVTQLKNDHSYMRSKVDTIWTKMFSHERHIGELKGRQSGHDINLNFDTDPPKGGGEGD